MLSGWAVVGTFGDNFDSMAVAMEPLGLQANQLSQLRELGISDELQQLWRHGGGSSYSTRKSFQRVRRTLIHLCFAAEDETLAILRDGV